MKSDKSVSLNGIEFLKSLELKEVSNRTFIHEDELKKFLNAEFQGINKTKAMGFIQILEREFNIDLNDLKSKYVAYLNEHIDEVKEPKQSLMMEEVQSEERKRGFFSFIFLLAAIGSIAYLVDKYDLLDFSSPSDIKTAQVIDDSEVKNAKINLEKISQPEKPKIVETAKKEESVISSEVSEEKALAKNQELSLNDVLSSDENKQNSSDKEEKKVENNDDLDLSKLNEDLKPQEDENTEAIQDETVAQVEENNETQNNNTEATTNEIYIMPSSKVWIGTIELDTLKKKDFLAPRGKRVDIDASNDKLIMIGHKFVKIYLNGELVKFKRKGPIRFKYIGGELIEINRKEFNSLAKGRQW